MKKLANKSGGIDQIVFLRSDFIIDIDNDRYSFLVIDAMWDTVDSFCKVYSKPEHMKDRRLVVGRIADQV